MELTGDGASRAVISRLSSAGLVRSFAIILKKPAGVCAVAVILAVNAANPPIADSLKESRLMSCDPALAARFIPRRPLLGRYEVCTDSRRLADVVPAGWAVAALDPADAFGAGGSYDRSTLARLYGGARPGVARGWTIAADRFESLTFISPHPNAALTALEPGTLVIRWICEGASTACKPPNAR
jgi:hypothetical protein